MALDQVFIYNRRGAFAPGMIYALARDVVAKPGTAGGPGKVMLRPDKRPRPLTLRVNRGDCLQINFTNLLSDPRVEQSTVPQQVPGAPPGILTEGDPNIPNWDNQPAERAASIHVIGMQLLGTIGSDGSNVGRNATSLVTPGNSDTYYLYAQREGTNLMYSAGAQTGSEGDGGTIAFGLFGAVTVEPKGSEWYRSQLTNEDMVLAQAGYGTGAPAFTPGRQPILDYDATYPPGHPRAGVPILRMTNGGEIVHSDLAAIITGPGRESLCNGWTYSPVPASPNRCQPFREFTVIFHDDIKAVQAFDAYNDPVLSHTLHSVRDGFAINYGTGGIGSEIIANRLGLGPEGQCNECKYEEFFLTSWAVGDPAMVTDVLANASDPATGNIATVALYPDDPSNVYHSYVNDHVKIRNLHAGPKEHHIFHLHAHQWLYTPDAAESSYLDSQAIGPGSSYTYDIAYDGGGNRNKTPGDAIFHCHFYPHFAQGMWAMWRNHDVYEFGTPVDAAGVVRAGNPVDTRALPDGEIVAGTPNPGVVPIPGLAMAPMPTADMPGYPFYIPGVAGHRPPKPPLDTEVDGGLPRHVVNGGVAHAPPLNRLDFDKVNDELDVTFLPETGTPLEVNAMRFHAAQNPVTGVATGITGGQPSYIAPATGTSAVSAAFRVNGLPGKPGAPFADPCVDDYGKPSTHSRTYTYRAAGFRLNATYNKLGWKNPQHHMEALDQDVGNFLSGAKPPEPFFFRANSNSCINFYITNLFPNVYQLDDFQVRTPTDVLGQHIHLVKFDVTSSDGSANGWNYEDGSLAPDEVTERIHAIRVFNECAEPTDPRDGQADGNGQIVCPVATEHPIFKNVPEVVATGLHVGAQTTIQRWYADKLINNSGDDRTLRTVYTHDHFAPSTQQQAGYYAGLLIEPENSTWKMAESGQPMGGRSDGGPTSWQAIIEVPDNPATPKDETDSYREFMFEAQDFALAYRAGANNALKPITDEITGVTLMGMHDPANAVNPPAKAEIGLPFLLQVAPQCPGGVARPCPEAISADDPGTFLLNYRNEPLPLRIRDPLTNTQAAGVAGDLSHAFRSTLGLAANGTPIKRADPLMDADPATWPVAPLTGGVLAGDPATPLFRTYEGDKVQVRTLVGAHEEGHNFTVHGLRWLFEPSWANSGYRSSQMYGISEHFEFEIPAMGAVKGEGEVPWEDYLYQGGSAVDNLWNGTWGIMRAYQGIQGDQAGEAPLATLSTNPTGKGPRNVNPRDFRASCPVYPLGNRDPRNKTFNIVAILARDLLPGGALVYNSRAVNGGPLTDPNAILYVHKNDLQTKGGKTTLKPGITPEPLVIRAAAGDCLLITLENWLPAVMPDNAGFSTMPMIIDQFQANQLAPSNNVGLHAGLVQYDMYDSDGANVGWNPVQTAAPGGVITYQWYAGDQVVCRFGKPVEFCAGKEDGFRVAVPTEFGATPLMSSDRIKHSQKGAIGALIIEPEGSTWMGDGFTLDRGREVCPSGARCSRVSATVTVTKADGTTTKFRDFALVFQDDLNLRCVGCGNAAAGDANAVPNLADSEDPEDSGQRALNYKTEPMWLRLGFAPDASLEFTRDEAFRDALSNAQVGGDPETPIFTVEVGTDVRFRVVQSGGHARNHVFTLHGHGWLTQPFTDKSRKMGEQPLSEWRGDQEGIGPSYGGNFLITHGAGGKGGVTGDYLFRDFASFQFDGGIWGLLRVCAQNKGGNIGNRECLPDMSGTQ
ncbi:MAG: copper oxidase [Gemmatimonadota bacterium]|nr:copper oxidase [Gemmatimonadota bacterium]